MALIGFTGEHATRLQEALLKVYGNFNKMDELLTKLDRSYGELTVANSNHRENVLSIVKLAAENDWLLPLLAKAREEVPTDTELEKIEQELTALAPPPGVSHFDMCRLSGSHIMVNRVRLRRALREISNPLGKRILVIKGSEKTGKSHSLQLISYLKDVRRSFELRFIDLDTLHRQSGTSKPIEPLPLAKGLARMLKNRFKPQDAPTDAQWSNWVLDFCDDFEDAAILDKQEWWIVIDSFNRVPLTQPAFDIIKEIALRINQTLSHLRLVLIGYTESLPPPVLPHVEEESIESIGPQQVLEFFRDAYEQMRLPLPDAEQLEEKVLGLLEKVDIEQPDFLLRLGPLASEELTKAFNPGGANG